MGKPPRDRRSPIADGVAESATTALVLGDQLTFDNPALARLDRGRDTVVMIEAAGEASHVWSHKARIALFLSAMRHFAEELRAAGYRVQYLELDTPGPDDFGARLGACLADLGTVSICVCEPGEWRMLAAIQDVCRSRGVALAVLPDTHFLMGTDEFRRWAGDRRTLRMEFFYRHMRQRTGILMQEQGPEGGRWNYDTDNRAGFGARGPVAVPEPPRFCPDALTRAVIALVERRFPDHPGRLDAFAWPVTRAQALEALARFVAERLAAFGRHQDAMWRGEPVLWHSLLSSSLNLKLLDPREVIEAALQAWREQRLPLASVEGFIRQILGWREFVRGVYWHWMPQLAEQNHFAHERALPRWYWTGATQMNCMGAAIGQTLDHGYAHHTQRLMVTGNFALLAGIKPRQVCDWYLAVYVDAVEWVELPNTAGMALFADGGRFTSKPYVASGAYIKRMSNYCRGCRYRPEVRTGPDACPMTVLYWSFLDRHTNEFARNPRTSLMAQNVARLDASERAAVRRTAERIGASLETV